MRQLAVLLISVVTMISLIACSGQSNNAANPALNGHPAAGAAAAPTPLAGSTASAAPAPFTSPGKLEEKPTVSPSSFSSEEEAKSVIEKRIKETTDAMMQKDMAKLAKLVDPAKGVQFSPYAYVDTSKDVRVKASELAALWKDTKKIKWGEQDGSGSPIELTFADYFQKFVYDHDFAKAPKIGYNKIIGKSTTTNNLFTVYPKDKFITVEFHFEGFDKKLGGQDWSSLRLVYENSGADWFLVAVVHDQWTI
ncbi:hypothetical protein [Paenibacillus sp. GP183]|jgi:hypothetical protein|uniref:hypothetical protein n=1 Tax=Paenibacillus sp. GP183 TaxID=1882751 RepID=UPI000899C8CE|nr:hypothetical protein [Paenibacillus sp. GP183]SEC50792.1 hypothetical protein SAMN05443246_4337 [Paenibacillus sp. GP183]